MNEVVNDPLQRRDVKAISGIVLVVLTFSSFVYAMDSRISDKADAAAVAAIKNEVRDIRDLLCDTPENASRRQCTRPDNYYRDTAN